MGHAKEQITYLENTYFLKYNFTLLTYGTLKTFAHKHSKHDGKKVKLSL
jgi:hypothetical protein